MPLILYHFSEEEDVVDSDFDYSEAPDDDVHEAAAEDDDEPIKRKRATASSGRYKDPFEKSRPSKQKAAVATGTDAPVVAATPLTPVYKYVATTVRSSTARKSSMSSEMRRRASNEAANCLPSSKDR